jgi:hypothetical protein
MIRTRLLSLLTLLLGTAVVLPGQVQTIDEGSFTLFLGAERVGREEFSLRRVPDGDRVVILSQATIAWDARRLAPALRTTATGDPVSYQIEIRDDGRVTTMVTASVGGGRLSQRVVTDKGESARQFPLSPGTLILDEDVVHQYYFVAQRGAGTIPVLVPRRLGRESVVVSALADTRVEIGTGTVTARHFTVTDAAGIVTDLWVDAAGRLLRLAVTARGFVAVRDEPPR